MRNIAFIFPRVSKVFTFFYLLTVCYVYAGHILNACECYHLHRLYCKTAAAQLLEEWMKDKDLKTFSTELSNVLQDSDYKELTESFIQLVRV